MPSDLTLQKVTRANTAVPAPVDRETAIMQSRRKANQLSSIPDPILQEMRENEAAAANRRKALAAGFLGAPMDIAQFAANRFAEALSAKKPELPYTTEDLRNRWGVEDSGWATLLGGLLSPDPVSTAAAGGKALILPMGYVRKAGRKADELYEAAVKMFKNGEDPAKIYRATGAFKGKSDEILWHKRDTGTIRPERMRELIDQRLPNPLAAGGEGFITVRPNEILEGDDELFEMFPYLENVLVRFHVKNRGTASKPEYIFRNDAMAKTSTRGQANYKKGEIDLFNAGSEHSTWQDSATSTLYHEMGHLIDAVTGALPTGGNIDNVTKSYTKLQEARAMRELFDDLGSGRVIEDWMNAPEDDAAFLMDLFDKYGLGDPSTVSDIQDTYFSYARALARGDEEAAYVIKTTVNGAIDRETATMGAVLQEYGQEVDLDSLDRATLMDIASDRYYRLEGEARQRINQYLIGKRDEEISAFFQKFAKGKTDEGVIKPVDPQDMILEEPVKVEPELFTGS